jgi:hypothetical protein
VVPEADNCPAIKPGCKGLNDMGTNKQRFTLFGTEFFEFQEAKKQKAIDLAAKKEADRLEAAEEKKRALELKKQEADRLRDEKAENKKRERDAAAATARAGAGVGEDAAPAAKKVRGPRQTRCSNPSCRESFSVGLKSARACGWVTCCHRPGGCKLIFCADAGCQTLRATHESTCSCPTEK